MTFWAELGFIRYPLAIVGLFLIVQTVRAILDLRGDGDAGGRAGELRVHTILLWGVLGAAIGMVGTLVGMSLVGSAVERANGAPVGLVWGGVKVALSSSVVGFMMLAFAAIAWLGLQAARGRRFESASPDLRAPGAA